MPVFALQPSTIDLIAERMKLDGYSSPDVLLREALASLKPTRALSAESIPSASSDLARSPHLDGEEDLELDLSYDSVPLQQARAVDATFFNAGELETFPWWTILTL